MGADTTSTQLIFFIAATVVATATAGIFTGAVADLTQKASERAKSFGHELESDVSIINDPNSVPNDPVVFYVKNTGGAVLALDAMTVLVDGTIVTTTNTLLGGETSFRTGAVVQVDYVTALAAGDHRVRVSMENGVYDELRFRV